MSIVRASSKFQIAIPKAIRSRLQIKPGQLLAIEEENGVITITPIASDPAAYLCGIFKDDPSLTSELLEERRGDLEHE